MKDKDLKNENLETNEEIFFTDEDFFPVHNLEILEEDYLPFELLPESTTHFCETKEVEGKTFWLSCMLKRAEVCPLCGKMELDENGYEIQKTLDK